MAIEILGCLGEDRWDRWVLIRWGGPLEADARATGSRVVLEPLRRSRVALRMWRPTRRLAVWLEQVVAGLVIAAVRPDVVWCNTALSACYVRPARLLGRKVVLHVHEPAGYIRHALGRYRLDGYWEGVSLVACSPTASSDLAATTGRPAGSVSYLPSVPNRGRVLSLAGAGHPDFVAGRLVVGACGTPDLRKGVDLWLEMVEAVAPELQHLDPLFLWIGGSAPDAVAARHEALLRSGRVRFVGQVDNPYPWLAGLDIFVLPSRVDPFPLVVLEVMTLGKPVVAFAVGDVAEQVGDAGVVMPPLAVESLAGAVVALGRDPAERERLGHRAQERVAERFSFEQFSRDVNTIAAGALGDSARWDHPVTPAG